MHHWLPSSLDTGWVRDACGYLAGSLVLCSFSVTSMSRLRWLGIASNLSFISYAIMVGMLPILILHGLLLPVNIYRLFQIERDRRRPGGALPDHSAPRFMEGATRGTMNANAAWPISWQPKISKMPASSWEMC